MCGRGLAVDEKSASAVGKNVVHCVLALKPGTVACGEATDSKHCSTRRSVGALSQSKQANNVVPRLPSRAEKGACCFLVLRMCVKEI